MTIQKSGETASEAVKRASEWLKIAALNWSVADYYESRAMRESGSERWRLWDEAERLRNRAVRDEREARRFSPAII